MERSKPQSVGEPDAIQRAIEYGVDISLLRENLRRTPAERIENAARWSAFLDGMEQGGAANEQNGVFGAKRLLEVFDREGVAFVIVGDVAAVVHGVRRGITMVLQLCTLLNEDAVGCLNRALTPFRPRVRGVAIDRIFQVDEQTFLNGMNLMLSTDACDLDLLGEVAGVGNYDKVLAESEQVLVYGREHKVLRLDALIRAKKAAGRQKDLNALPELEALLELKKRGNGWAVSKPLSKPNES
ncbi:MAG: hypothetical protein KGJ80_11865 [Chloroflexota bacterium]|nr:hypothetical protein [Chloroflexota bacterium]